jgi:ABC-type polysaccharide/polyol phosphate transport system ATPase subunit
MTATPKADAPIIHFHSVGKRYILHKQRPFLLHETFKRLLGRRHQQEEFWAVRDIGVTIARGESVGLVGGNGAGKSTMMSLTAGTIAPTLGRVTVTGRISGLLELGAGFHPDLTGRENIYLNASLLGLRREEVEEQFKSIVDFSELHTFIDVPIRNYSSGMHVRLGFAVATHIDPDILLMDEVLAVGDQNFQQKCIARILKFRDEGKTILFVSHSADAVKKLCQRVIWLEKGRIRMEGPTDKVLAAYTGGA